LMNKKILFLDAIIIIFSICSLGCGIQWTTINYINLSDNEIWVDIDGTYPNLSPGVLLPGTGTEQLKRKSGEYAGPIIFEDIIKIAWTVEGTSSKQAAELKRKDFGIPSEVHGGRVKIIYTETDEWRMEFSKKWWE